MPATREPFRWTAAAGSDTGRVRENNEDVPYAGRWLYAVADGLGGHPAGEVASAAVIGTLRAWDTEASATEPLSSIADAIRAAGRQLRSMTADDPALRGMGTTLTAILMSTSGDRAAFANMGDSRAYLLRGGQLRQLTEDHVMGKLIAGASGQIAAVLARYLDGRPDRSPDLALRETRPGDRYLLCTDGLTSAVPAAAIRGVLTSSAAPGDIVRQLIRLANEAGGPDNTTVVIVDIHQD
jgi:PPM family protein phosphatase